MTIDVEVLTHAVDVHVHPTVVLHAADVHREPRVALVDRGVDPGGFLEHVGGMTWRTLVDLVAGDHADRARREVDPVAVTLGADAGGVQFQALAIAAQALQADTVGAVEAIAHRVVLQQDRKPFLSAVLATQAGAAQPGQLAAVEEHLDLGLLGERKHCAVQGLGRNVETDQGSALACAGALLCCVHRGDPHRQGAGAQHQAAGQGNPVEPGTSLLWSGHVCRSLCWRFLVMKINLNNQTSGGGKVSK